MYPYYGDEAYFYAMILVLFIILVIIVKAK